MSVVAILAHVLSIAHGVGASLACAACFYIGGLALIPRRWDDSLGRGESPALLGAAFYVILCWFGIAWGVPLTRLAIGFTGLVLVLAALRRRSVVRALNDRVIRNRATHGWLLVFVLLYVLAYLFTLPPATAESLEPAWGGNVDLLSYVLWTKYLLRLGQSNLVGYSYLDYVYLFTPAVFYVLGWFSLLFNQQPIAAAMPAQFALIALTGVFAARISRSVFTVSRGAALAIACILVSGPFLRYIAFCYFLSTLMSTPIVLYLLWTTVSHRSQRVLDAGLAIRFGSAYVLLLFLYPFLLAVGLAAQLAAVVLTLVAEVQSGDARGPAWRGAGQNAGRTMFAILLPLAVLAVGLRERVTWSANLLRPFSQPGVAGWPLDLISPSALLGLPRMVEHIQVNGDADRVWAVAVYSAVAVAFGFLYFWRLRHKTTTAERTLGGLAGGSFILYVFCFLQLGPSYQQWKFASYTALPLSFMVFAGGLQRLRQSAVFARLTRTAERQRLVAALMVGVAVGLVGGNLVVHALSDPVLKRFHGGLRNLEDVDALPFFREMSVQMSDEFLIRVALYFLPNKRVHVISPTFKPSEPLAFERITRQRPLLVQNYGCEGVGHDETMTVPGVGCLVLAPPSLKLGASYPFNQSFLFVDFEGMTGRDGGGRWNTRPTLLLKLSADPRRSRIIDPVYVNLLVNPFLPAGTPPQRLVFSWGKNQRGEALMSDRGWISLPVFPGDWTGEWLWTLPISIDFPDRRRFLFEQLSSSITPRGRVVSPN